MREGVLDPADTTGRRKAGIDVSAFARRNAGVEARDKRDKAQLQVRTFAMRHVLAVRSIFFCSFKTRGVAAFCPFQLGR